MSLRREQVHIAPQGYERERVYKPAIDNQADKVILVEHVGDSETDEGEISKAQECRSEVQRELMQHDISFNVEECDFFDVTSVAMVIAELAHANCGGDTFVNVSTGSKLCAIGAMIACTATEAQPYYVPAEGYIGETITTGVKPSQPISTYPLSLPHEQYLKVLRYVDEQGSVIKRDIVEFAQELPLLSEYDRKQERNMYEPVTEEIIEPLVEQRYLSEMQLRGKVEYELTEEGESTLEILSYLVR